MLIQSKLFLFYFWVTSCIVQLASLSRGQLKVERAVLVCKVDLPHWTLTSQLPAERRRWPRWRWPTFNHSLLLPCLALLPRSTLAQKRPAAKDAQILLNVSACHPVVAKSSGASAWNINLRYPPLVIHFLIAQNLWPPVIARICLVVPNFVVQLQTGPKHGSNYCIARNLAIWSAWHLLAVRTLGPAVSTPSPVPSQRYAPKCHLGTFTKMHWVFTSHQNPGIDKYRRVFPYK